MPNQGIPINTLGLQEAKDSSEIENIVTTHDGLFKDDVHPESFANPADIATLMRDLERFIDQDELMAVDPLIKMALIHHQFESIHPFYDGNGRTGRIMNGLYLVKEGLLGIPVLYLSSQIVRTKADSTKR